MAVHSAKDLPSELPSGLVLSGVPQREDPRDAVTPLDGKDDRPSTIADQLTWLAEGGFTSVVSGGAFFEPLKAGYIRVGPSLQYVHEFSTTYA